MKKVNYNKMLEEIRKKERVYEILKTSGISLSYGIHRLLEDKDAKASRSTKRKG